MNKWMAGLSVLLVSVMILAGCGKSGEDDMAAAAASGESVKAITITAKNFEFAEKEIRVAKGDTVKITLKNEQGNHAVKINGYNKEIQNGKTVTFSADKAGEFEFACSIFCGGGHEEMKGKLIVE